MGERGLLRDEQGKNANELQKGAIYRHGWSGTRELLR